MDAEVKVKPITVLTFCTSCNRSPDLDECEKLLRCGSCKVTYYCSENCQKDDWTSHKSQCHELEVKPTSKKNLDAKLLTLARQNSKAEYIKKVVDAGADVNTTSNGGSTPLMIACSEGNNRAAPALIACGAQVNAQVNKNNSLYGYTALMFATQESHFAICILLLEHGAKAATKAIYKRNKKANKWECPEAGFSTTKHITTALSLAIKNGNKQLVSLLLEHGAQKVINEPCYSVYNSFFVEEQVLYGETPISMALNTKDEEMCLLLIKYGAYVNAIELTRVWGEVNRGRGEYYCLVLAAQNNMPSVCRAIIIRTLSALGFAELFVGTTITEESSCSVCFEDYTENTIVIQLDCNQPVNHHVCLKCANELNDRHQSCPICRALFRVHNPRLGADYNKIHHLYRDLTSPEQAQLKRLLDAAPISDRPAPDAVDITCRACNTEHSSEILIRFTCTHAFCLPEALKVALSGTTQCPTCKKQLQLVDPIKTENSYIELMYHDLIAKSSERPFLEKLRSYEHIPIYQEHIPADKRIPIVKTERSSRPQAASQNNNNNARPKDLLENIKHELKLVMEQAYEQATSNEVRKVVLFESIDQFKRVTFEEALPTQTEELDEEADAHKHNLEFHLALTFKQSDRCLRILEDQNSSAICALYSFNIMGKKVNCLVKAAESNMPEVCAKLIDCTLSTHVNKKTLDNNPEKKNMLTSFMTKAYKKGASIEVRKTLTNYFQKL